MVFEQFTPKSIRTKKQRKERIKRYILEFVNMGNTKERSVVYKKLRMWMMGLLVIDYKEFEEAIEDLKENKLINVIGGLIV